MRSHSVISGGSGLCSASSSEVSGDDRRLAGLRSTRVPSSTVRCDNDPSTFHAREDSMAEKNKKKTYLILIAVLLVVLLITFL
mgnify:CR=1 FL=1